MEIVESRLEGCMELVLSIGGRRRKANLLFNIPKKVTMKRES